MFEEVPRERRGVARLLARPVVLGPFVVGSGMLVAALGGSVAVATAATVITASAISSPELPPRPGHPVVPASSTHTPAPTRHSTAHRVVTPAPATPRPPAAPSGAVVAGQSGASSEPINNPVQTSTQTPPTAPVAATGQPPAGQSSAAAPSGSALTPPSGNQPLGNALVYFTGYDEARGRIAYQFASRQSGNAGTYRVSGPAIFTATLAGSLTITSGGSLCPPAGSSCSPDQLFNAAESGFFAEVAIDAVGALRSVVEVAGQSAADKAAPSTTPSLDSTPQTSPAGRLAPPQSSSPAPETSSAAAS
jgi:hypothetical protein